MEKNDALKLWELFISSKKSDKEQCGYGPGGYSQFVLIMYNNSGQKVNVSLITNGLYDQEVYNRPIKDNDLKTLITPYGSFDLTVEEASKMREQWRVKGKFEPTLEELKTLLENSQ
jgi:hypothetical protein